MNPEQAEKRADEKAKRRGKKQHPAMKMTGKGMKRFSRPGTKKD